MDIENMVNEVRKKYKLQQIIPEWIHFLKYVGNIKPKVILEIGIGSGASSLCFSHFTDYLLVVDSSLPHNQNIFNEIHKNCELDIVIKDSASNECVSLVKHFLKDKKVDLLFIDGGHTHESVKKDFINYTTFLAPNGVVALHDIVDSPLHRKNRCDVYKYWNELKNKFKSREFTIADWGGIGVIRLGKNKY